jgi:hypothetical protein
MVPSGPVLPSARDWEPLSSLMAVSLGRRVQNAARGP